MSLSTLAVRIPESMHRYVKQKALDTNSNQQDFIRQMIAEYQLQDTEFMARFPEYCLSHNTPDTPDEECCDDV